MDSLIFYGMELTWLGLDGGVLAFDGQVIFGVYQNLYGAKNMHQIKTKEWKM